MSRSNQFTVRFLLSLVLGTLLAIAILSPSVFCQGTMEDATRLDKQANHFYHQGKYSEAILLAQQVLEIRRRVLGRNHKDVAAILNNLGLFYSSLGQYAEAERTYNQALEVEDPQGKDSPDYAVKLSNLAVLYHSTAQYAKAEPLYQRAKEIMYKAFGKDHLVFATSLNNLGGLYNSMGKFDKAELFFKQALEIKKKTLGPTHPIYANSLINLAVLYKSLGQYTKAESYFKDALEIMKALGENHPNYATSLSHLAALVTSDEAEPLYKQALEIRKKALGEDHPDYATSLSELAGLYQSKDQYGKAEPLYERALRIRKKTLGEGHPDYAISLNNLALLYYSTGQYEKAEPIYKQAMEITKETLSQDHLLYAAPLENLASLYQTTGRPTEALALMEQSMQGEQSRLRQIFSFSSEPAMQAYLATRRPSFYALLSMVTAQKRTSGPSIDMAFNWTLRRKSIILDTLMKFRAAQSLVERDDAFAAEVARFRYLKQRLSNLQLHRPLGMTDAELQREMKNLREESEQLEGKLNRALAKLGQQEGEEITVETVRRGLPAGTALVEFVRVDQFDFKATGQQKPWKPAHYYAFVLTAAPHPSTQLIDLGEAEKIEEAVKTMRQKFERYPSDSFRTEQDKEDEFRVVSKELYRLIFTLPGLDKALGSATKIYLAPDSQLNLIPFEALVDARSRYLIESFHLAYLSSGKDLLRTSPNVAHGTVVFAAPDYDLRAAQREREAKALLPVSPTTSMLATRGSRDLRGLSWTPLDGAKQEAKDIELALAGSRFAPLRTYVGPAAVEEVFKSLRSPRVLHVASHGYFLPDEKQGPEDGNVPVDEGLGFGQARGFARLRGAENPLLRSGIVLAGANAVGESSSEAARVDDGWVTAEEIAMMDLRGTELVVLSACESGQGDVKTGEGVFGLRRAFLHAGARTLVTSLNKVPDAETRDLMQRFYASLSAGKSKLEALRQAQLAMIKKRRMQGGAAHPFFWASFVLVGDPN